MTFFPDNDVCSASSSESSSSIIICMPVSRGRLSTAKVSEKCNDERVLGKAHYGRFG